MRNLIILLVLFYCSLAHSQVKISVVGTTANPATDDSHVPFLIPAVALDAAGNPYTVHDWDEPGFKIDRWSTTTNQVAWHSTGIINDLLDAIAVEPDGSYAYTTGWNGTAGNLNLTLWKTNLSTGATVLFGSSGHINIVSGSTTSTLPIALSGQDLWVTELTANTVAEYDKTTGTLITSFAVTAPFGITVDGSGNLWIGTGTSVSVYSSAGTLLATPITGLTHVYTLSIGGSTLFVGDQGASNIKQYTISGVTATYVKTIGYSAHPGETSGNGIWQLTSVATNAAGDMIFTQFINGSGSRLHYAIGHVWDAICSEFQSTVTHSVANPNLFIGGYQSDYNATRGTTNVARWGGVGRTDAGSYFGHYTNGVGGTPKVLTLGGNDFYYFSCMGGNPVGGLAIYRVAATRSGWGPALQFCGALGNCAPYADGTMYPGYTMKGQWDWNDTIGPGLPKVDASTNLLNDPGTTIVWGPTQPYYNWSQNSFQVDDNGTIWIALEEYEVPGKPPIALGSIWAIPLHGLNSAGNPVYHWSEAVQVVDNATLCAAMGLPTGTANASPIAANLSLIDGELYILAVNPNGVSHPWMDGNTLMAFACTGPTPTTTLLWSHAMTNYVSGLCPVPLSTGGFIAGQNVGPGGDAVVQRFDKNGNLTASYNPPSSQGPHPIGAFDTFGPVNACLAPDGTLDIYGENDWSCWGDWWNPPN